MKRALKFFGVICLIGLIAYLSVTKYLSAARADRLDKALLDAEGRAAQLEAELQAANQKLAALAQNQGASSGTAATSESSAAWSQYSSAGAGVTNLIRIEGTSSVHNWQVESHLIGGTAQLGPGFAITPGASADQGVAKARVSVFIPVRSLKSVEHDGRPYSDPMDEIMYGKLLEAVNRRITFVLDSLTLKEAPNDPTKPFLYEAKGRLAVAGVTNVITMPVSVAPNANGKIQFSGSVPVKMTSFNITPPAPSLGPVVIKTGDEVTLKFIWWVKLNNSSLATK